MLCLCMVIPAEAEEGELSFSFLFPISDGVVVAVVVVMKTRDGSGNNYFHKIPWKHDIILTCWNYTGLGTWRKWYFQKDSYWCYVWFTPSRREHMVWRVSHTQMNEWMVKHLISRFEQCLLTTLSMQFEKQLWDPFLGCWIGILFGCIIKVQSPLNWWACFGWLWFDCT